ncbi:MAG: hypothetical protein ACE5H8_13670 [Alphaproteobacteria bacterium]
MDRETAKEGGSDTRLRDHFLGWQCRLRQHAMRRFGGRPSPGMRPRVMREHGGEIAPAMTVLLVERDPAESVGLFRHVVRKTHDPERRYRDALRMLSSAYFQQPRSFSDVMTALFSRESAVADTLVSEGRCRLEFEQYGQRYRVPCTVAELASGDPSFEATYWHNHMFNPAMPGAMRVLAFTPDWRRAAGNPPV